MLYPFARALALSILLLSFGLDYCASSHDKAESCANGGVCESHGLLGKSPPGKPATVDTDTLTAARASAIEKIGVQGAALLAQAWPTIQPVGISGLVGYACGLVARRVLQVLLLAVAFVVSAVQVLVYMKWVTVHWEQINGDLARLLGSGSDAAGGAAGGVDVATLVGVASERLAAVMSQGLPSVAGFATGLTLAFMPGMAFA